MHVLIYIYAFLILSHAPSQNVLSIYFPEDNVQGYLFPIVSNIVI